jgi:hypothetical protein
MSNDVKLEQAADEAARSALSEEWPNGYDLPEREAFKAGFLAGARYQSQQREAVFAVGVKPGDIPPSATVVDPPAASRDDQDLFNDICDKMEEALKQGSIPVAWNTRTAAEREAVLEEAAKVARDYASKAHMREWITTPQSAALAASHIAKNIRALKTTPAPAVSTDEIDELLYSVIRMPLSNKGGELVSWRKTMSGRLSAILSRLRGEGG